MIRKRDIGVLQQLHHLVDIRIAQPRERIVGTEQIAPCGEGEPVRYSGATEVGDIGAVDRGAYPSHSMAIGECRMRVLCLHSRSNQQRTRRTEQTAWSMR